MNRLLMTYFERLPGSMHETELPGGSKVRECIFSPYSLRATAATLLLDSGVPIEAVQDLLDHKHITTTQILRQAAAGGKGFGLAQDASVRGYFQTPRRNTQKSWESTVTYFRSSTISAAVNFRTATRNESMAKKASTFSFMLKA